MAWRVGYVAREYFPRRPIPPTARTSTLRIRPARFAPKTGPIQAALLVATIALPALPDAVAGQAPRLDGRTEAAWIAAGAGALTIGALLPLDVRSVPTTGLDAADIPIGWDRSVVGNFDLDASSASDVFLVGSQLFPAVVALAVAPGDDRIGAAARRGVVYAEATLMAQGLTLLGKNAFGRARPFTYLSDAQRPSHSQADVTLDRAFRSMPSGHSAGAWTAGSFAVTEYLLWRPQASGWSRAGIGFVAGLLGGTTSILRVEAGQHFPTDVTAGALVGVASGVVLPLSHRGAAPMPPRRAWIQSLAGALAGVGIASVLVDAF